jgi:hypothetical protein
LWGLGLKQLMPEPFDVFSLSPRFSLSFSMRRVLPFLSLMCLTWVVELKLGNVVVFVLTRRLRFSLLSTALAAEKLFYLLDRLPVGDMTFCSAD